MKLSSKLLGLLINFNVLNLKDGIVRLILGDISHLGEFCENPRISW